MARLKFKLNLFDIILLTAILLIVLLISLGWDNQPYLGSRDMIVTVKIDDGNTINNIRSQLVESGELCLDSYRYCGEQVEAKIINPDGVSPTYVLVTIKGVGDINEDKSIFMGHRVYANQLVQLRGNYVADGRITDFYYEG